MQNKRKIASVLGQIILQNRSHYSGYVLLTENGIAEATALSRALSLEGMTHAYTSPLGRAKLTAELALVGIPKFSNRYYGDPDCFPLSIIISPP